jgi:hypothetical protein
LSGAAEWRPYAKDIGYALQHASALLRLRPRDLAFAGAIIVAVARLVQAYVHADLAQFKHSC